MRLAVIFALLAGCSMPEQGPDPGAVPPAARAEVLVTGAGISGANGLHFAPDGSLYVASVIGSELVILDPQTGAVQGRLTEAQGVVGPDDVAFGPDGAFFWTSILTGQVAGFTAAGERVVAAQLGPGVNPITFADDGRLFVAQCFFDDGLFEVDPAGRREPRAIATDLGPGCGLNGMDWGPDQRLYGPRWFRGEVVSFDVTTGERRLEAEGFDVPAAVKFDSRGRLHVLDTGAGAVVRIADGAREVVAQLMPGLDNLAFDSADRLFVSSFTDGAVWRVADDGSLVELSPPGMAHPGGVAVLEADDGSARVHVADLHALRTFAAATGEPLAVERNILGVGELGSVLAVAADGDRLLLTAFTENAVRVWDPAAGQVVERHDDLDAPVSAIRYAGRITVAEHGTGQVVGLDGGARVILADGLPAPTGLATDGARLFVSDRRRGAILEIARAGSRVAPRVVADGLAAPEGIVWAGDALLAVEGETGRVLRIDESGAPTLLAMVAPGTAAASPAQPPSLVFNGIAVHDGAAYVTGESSRVLYRIDLGASMSAVE